MRIDYNPEYASHLAVLADCLAATTGPILELGVGLYSTPMIETLAALGRRYSVHCEFDAEWLNECVKRSRKVHIRDWADWPPDLVYPHFGFAFVDSGPSGLERLPLAKWCVAHADVVLIHDAHIEEERHYRLRAELLPLVRYHYFDRRLRPESLVCGNSKTALKLCSALEAAWRELQ